MNVKIRMNKNIMIAELIGELDHHNAKAVREKLETFMINKSVKNLIFDFTDLSFMDSSGIGMIIGRYKLVSALGGDVKIICTNSQIKKLIVMSGLSKIIKVYESVNDALKNA